MVYQSFYVYLYSVSILFVVFVYTVHLRRRAVFSVIKTFSKCRRNAGGWAMSTNLSISNRILGKENLSMFAFWQMRKRADSLGNRKWHSLEVSICGWERFRLALERWSIPDWSLDSSLSKIVSWFLVMLAFELHESFYVSGNPECTTILTALTPCTRMLLSIIQMQFIFMNTTDLDFGRHKVVARFGLMHMVASNLCEWLYVLVEETKHDIHHFHHNPLAHKYRTSMTSIMESFHQIDFLNFQFKKPPQPFYRTCRWTVQLRRSKRIAVWSMPVSSKFRMWLRNEN